MNEIPIDSGVSMKRVLHDGKSVYEPHVYKNESELLAFARQHAKLIFGADAIWLPGGRIGAKPGQQGAKGKPDAFVIQPVKYNWVVVEVELARHDLHRHINPQISRFAVAWKRERKELVDQLTKKCKANQDVVDELKALGYPDIHEFLSDLVENKPDLAVIIDGENQELYELEDIWNFRVYWSIFNTYHLVGTRGPELIHHIGLLRGAMTGIVESIGRRKSPPHWLRKLIFLGKTETFRYSKFIPVMVAEELIRIGKFPSAPFGFGGDRFLVNSVPTHANGNDFFQPEKLSNGWFIETHASESRNRFLAEKLIEHCGIKDSSVRIEQIEKEESRT